VDAIALPRPADGLVRVALIGSTVAILVLVAIELAYGWTAMGWQRAIGGDLNYYASLATRMFSGHGWFAERQLHGPWVINFTDEVLYPPVVVWLFAPFIVLPVGVLIAAAIAVIAWLLHEWRPAAWTWPILALCLLWPTTLLKTIGGTSTLFMMMAVGLGLRYRWPAVLILVKPSFLPLALIGVRSRGWWLGVAALAILSLPFLADTLAYPGVMLNSRNVNGALYSLEDLPMMLIPLIAWAGRTRQALVPGGSRRPSAPMAAWSRSLTRAATRRGRAAAPDKRSEAQA
jgi:hypothetical protein